MEAEMQGSVGARRLAVHYALLGLVTAAVVVFVFTSGTSRHAQKQIAGGYDVSAATACLGPKIELAQSGRFVTISNAQSTISGALKWVDGRLSGAVHCLRGHVAQIDAHVASGVLAGSLGGLTVAAELKRDPPEPGAPKPRAPRSVAGEYQLAPTSACLGGKMKLAQSGSTVKVVTSKKPRGTLIYKAGVLAGAISCEHGGQRTVAGTAAGRALDLILTPPAVKAAAPPAVKAAAPPASKVAAPPAVKAAAPPAGKVAATGTAVASETVARATGAEPPEHIAAAKQRTAENTVVAFFIAVVVVMLFARLCGSVMPRIGQPRVMGEVLAGILLGPTLFGALAPGLQSTIFAPDIVPFIGVVANLGLIFYMFLIGLEVDLGQLRGRARMTLAISNTALLVPLMLGMLVALPLYPLLAPDIRFAAFALFVGVSMSITAFPVLARIIAERRMLKRPLGALALSAAAVDDVSAWFLIALATAVASAGSGVAVLETIGWAAVFCLGMAFLVRPILARAAVAHDEAGRVPGTWITAIFAGVLLSAIATEKIGIAVIFGAFVMGIAMPRHAGLSEDVTRRVEDFVLTLLLPLFFAYTGLRTNVALLGQGQLIAITALLCAIAILGKYGGTLLAARAIRLPWRESAVLGALMNTRGLTELIVLNLALSTGAISAALFTALVIMALVTTFMAGPLMRLLDPHNAFGEEPEQELASASAGLTPAQRGAAGEHAILVAPQSEGALEQLLALAQPLARSQPRRELILARLVRPPRGATVRGGLQTEARRVSEATEQLQGRRAELLQEGFDARAVALTSADPGRDLTRLCRGEEIDLLLLDGRRPLLGDGVPREAVGTVLGEARCDVAVLVAREGVEVNPGPDRSVMVPFGGADHDWAALELASWIAAASGAPLRLLGASGQRENGRDASGLLANAALVVQQFAGISAEPVLAEPGREGILAAAAAAGLLIVGLSERWRKEGLGETRRAIARSAPAPIVFVRRGERRGALAPATDMTQFGWSTAGIGQSA
ncbi:MAG TPA: cation:proton antiporter [Solirubrobacteraceae bacterium]|jgi:Kef-type K+ transport system membrane component KefB